MSEVEVVTESVPVSSSVTIGEWLDCPIEGDIRVSLRTGTGSASGEKNLMTNVYSAVVLSIRTRSADRSSDSIGAFCWSRKSLGHKMRADSAWKAHVVLIITHVCQGDPRSINSGVFQP
jgi:hypothetical protein